MIHAIDILGLLEKVDFHSMVWADVGDNPKKWELVDRKINSPSILSKVKVPKELFHVTRKKLVDKILNKEGLKVNQKRVTKLGPTKGKIYLANDCFVVLDDPEWDNVDTVVFKVKTAGLKLRLDPEYYYMFLDKDGEVDGKELVKYANSKPGPGLMGGLNVYATRDIPKDKVRVTTEYFPLM